MLEVRVPLHVTGFWVIRWGRDEYESGSLGAGLVLKPMVRVRLRRGCTCILNNVELDLRHVKVIRRLLGLRDDVGVEVESPVELGQGYGLSSCICLGMAVLAGLVRGDPLLRSLQLAHLVEVKLMTGLGDVIAQLYGGEIEVRVRQGAPGIGHVVKVPASRKVKVVTVPLGRMSTTEMLRELYPKIQTVGKRCLERFLESPSLEKLFECANAFSRELKLLTQEVESSIDDVKSICIGYFVKKGILVMAFDEDALDRALLRLRARFKVVRAHDLTDEGLKIVETSRNGSSLSAVSDHLRHVDPVPRYRP